ncbi:helix-turn-helix domain-containing protein [Enterococcus viikkiensis]|uniref:Helix-turn-helix domain-containing protein n=1 Tax=Enterococcus viikkiensis TaxID=930854 RepID=A0ABU3FSC9_9ENTE|nr:helix-turn-helix domain-containing protein [Enterococcus viikkiensis]MDT2828548.1 helix-turn-helix domain-containing protein [Enterococcus viikkiensis]
MKKVIILTRNIIIEQDFQNELQRLDYEVFVLKEFFAEDKPQYFEEILSLFDIVIFSETLTNQEFTDILPIVLEKELHYLRRTDEPVPNIDDNHCLSIECTLTELREFLLLGDKRQGQSETISKGLVRQSEQKKQDLVLFYSSLNNIEKKIISALAEGAGKIISRDELCNKVWNHEVSKSRLVQMSTAVGNIRKKIAHAHIDNVRIITYWGNGYRLHDVPNGLMNDHIREYSV